MIFEKRECLFFLDEKRDEPNITVLRLLLLFFLSLAPFRDRSAPSFAPLLVTGSCLRRIDSSRRQNRTREAHLALSLKGQRREKTARKHLATMATDGAAARALDFVKKADKRLTAFSLFGGNKYEDAADLLEKAATQYKLAKCCEW